MQAEGLDAVAQSTRLEKDRTASFEHVPPNIELASQMDSVGL